LLQGLTGFTIVTVLSIFIALMIIAVGRDIAAKGEDTPGKLAPYACGEDIPSEPLMVNVEGFFIYAVYFMIFDILAFVLATTIANRRMYSSPFSSPGHPCSRSSC